MRVFFSRCIQLLLTDPIYFCLLASLVVFGDAILTQLIIRFVPYTEIDWETYMLQIELYMKGERDYALIEGPTGPLVYPAGHVYIHQFLYTITDSGRNIARAQNIYGLLYITSLILTCTIYRRAKGVPNWIVFLLPLSKRLHSIFALRLFGDCWAVVATQAAILAYGKNWDDIGTLFFSAALSIKMSVLLYLPGLAVILFKRHGLVSTLRHLSTIVLAQAALGYPFLRYNPSSYLAGAFDLSRVFLYKWTVNWRFVDEQTFLSPLWARSLLVLHLCTLIAFGLWRWCRRDGGVWRTLERGLRRPTSPARLAAVTADQVTTILFTSNLIGIMFARSLHYQFYSWYAQQLPFLAWRTRYPIPLKIVLLLCVEYAWNVFPSTPLSSAVLFGSNAMVLLGVWFGYAEGVGSWPT
ncbi:glycosyltransferase family 58 protein [Jaapia argillacea MUCL 33604]|uniref:Dol-P-Man:Man(5)GlcNAc(2)-PP-Dol alpha-1,3-mannosyltransferase n=1 Tax=Jaapia argillacea MUCL 33604 TaxID=933084 RepID=A0A067Q3K8_9AGAM|nr:glycosyltransferase family 58 protein [Jaapia argillacea MUCL 33604]